MISDPIVSVMVDNRDGTYHYDFTLNQIGKVTIQVILVTDGIAWDFYTGSYFNTLSRSSTTPNINFGWGNSGPYGRIDYFSNIFTAYFVPSTTENYMFSFLKDDSVHLLLNNQIILSLNTPTAYSTTVSTSTHHFNP